MNLNAKFYEQMLLIRLFEESIEKLFSKGVLFGTVHSCIGQEAIAVGIANAVDKDDIFISNHRGHGHFIALTDELEGLLAEIMGKKTGVCGGRGGSQHLCKGNFYSNGITAGMSAVATGIALAEKIKKNKRIIICFLGDGALGEGISYESMNISSLWKLPIVFIIENNYYAMSTHISQAIAGKIVDRGKAFGIDSEELPGNDVVAIYSRLKSLVEERRREPRPSFLVIDTYRLCGHSKSDDRCYRNKEEEELWRKKDPLIISGSQLEDELKKNIADRCRIRIDLALEKAYKA
jgi:TPP-dependent pyruvate/acetoin dehydrogenase alpha subunit